MTFALGGHVWDIGCISKFRHPHVSHPWVSDLLPSLCISEVRPFVCSVIYIQSLMLLPASSINRLLRRVVWYSAETSMITRYVHYRHSRACVPGIDYTAAWYSIGAIVGLILVSVGLSPVPDATDLQLPRPLLSPISTLHFPLSPCYSWQCSGSFRIVSGLKFHPTSELLDVYSR